MVGAGASLISCSSLLMLLALELNKMEKNCVFFSHVEKIVVCETPPTSSFWLRLHFCVKKSDKVQTTNK